MRMDRRAFLGAAGLGGLWPRARGEAHGGVWVNDIHSQLNRTRVHEIVSVSSADAVAAAVGKAARTGQAVSIAGGRHAMGGQPFGTDTVLLDMRGMSRLRRLDAEAGLLEVEAGMQWPELIAQLHDAQRGRFKAWSIVQKQTGADRLTIGGALAANVHGRGLTLSTSTTTTPSSTAPQASATPPPR